MEKKRSKESSGFKCRRLAGDFNSFLKFFVGMSYESLILHPLDN